MDNVAHVERVVLLIHGIRTQADWQPMVVNTLEEKGKIKVIPIKYGYFDVFRFWSPIFTRQDPINRIAKEFRSARKKYPYAKVSVISHSFGTYIIGKLLKEQFDLELDRLILCGSILPSSYPWEDVIHKFIDGNNEHVLSVINECGKKDFWPVLAKASSWGYGDSGTHGFGQVLVKDRYHDMGHSEYLSRDFVATYWKPFVKNGEYIPTKFEENMPATPWSLSMLGWSPLKWILFALIIYIGVVGNFIPPLFPTIDGFQKKPAEDVSSKKSIAGILYIQIDESDSSTDGDDLSKRLKQSSIINVVGGIRTQSKLMPKVTEVRYFHDEDKEKANQIQEILKRTRPDAVLVRPSLPAPKGQLEIWLTKN